jgi:MFS family permease
LSLLIDLFAPDRAVPLKTGFRPEIFPYPFKNANQAAILPAMSRAQQLLESLRAFTLTFRNRELRSLQLAGIGSTLGTWAYLVALAVYAYHAGGARAVGLIAFVRWGLAAGVAPWLALVADRVSRRRVMLAADLTRVALAAGMAALAALDGPSLAVYALAVFVSIVSTAFPPAQAALLPSLATTPEELTSANVAMSTIASVGFLVGPAIGGVVLAVSGPSAVFAVTAGTFLWSALCVLQVRNDPRPKKAEGDAAALLDDLLAGFRAIFSAPALRIVIGLTAAQTLVTGAVEVLLVVVALRFVGAGNSGVGWLNSAFGVGGLLGALVVAALAGRKRLAGDFGVGVLLWGLPLALMAAWASLGLAFALFVVIGIGNTLVDVSGITLMQRTATEDVLARVFGVLESLALVTLAVGAAVAPALVAALGIRASLIAVGSALPVAVLLLWPKLRAIDAGARVPEEALALLRSIAMFAPLPPPVLERLAASAALVTFGAGDVVFSRGEAGDRFYAIEAGRAAVELGDGATRELGPGDFFGEIALLRDVPRTATVRALAELRLCALERDDFIAAVTGHAPSRAAADSVLAARLPAGALL